MTTKTGTLEEVLLLTRGILCADLLTVDTLNGKTLKSCKSFCIYVCGQKYYREIHKNAPCHLPWRGTRRTPREPPGRPSDPCSR